MENEKNIPVETKQEPDKKGKKKKIAIIIAIIVALLIALFGGILIYKNGLNRDAKNLEDKIKAQMGIMDGMTPAEIEETLAAVVEEGTLRIGINMNPVFVDGNSEGTLDIENHPNNHYNMRCTIVCDLNEDGEIGKGETLYHSGLMPINKDNPDPEQRGSHIMTDKLEVNLPAGDYECTALFTAHDVETDSQVGAVNANIKITVLN